MKNKIIFFLLFLPALYGQTIYHVATNGNNANSGLSEALAFRTLSHAESNLSAADFAAGAVYILVHEGTYTDRLDIDGDDYSPGPSSPLIISAFGTDLVELADDNLIFASPMIIRDVNYVTVNKINIDYHYAPLLCQAVELDNAQNILLNDMGINDCSYGIRIESDCSGVTISGCELWDWQDYGISCTADDVLITSNILRDTAGGTGLILTGTEGVRILNNLFDDLGLACETINASSNYFSYNNFIGCTTLVSQTGGMNLLTNNHWGTITASEIAAAMNGVQFDAFIPFRLSRINNNQTDIDPPPVPEILSVEFTFEGIRIKWDGSTTNYRLYRTQNTNSWYDITNYHRDIIGTEYIDSLPSTNTRYYYFITALDGAVTVNNESFFSEPVPVSVNLPPSLPLEIVIDLPENPALLADTIPITVYKSVPADVSLELIDINDIRRLFLTDPSPTSLSSEFQLTPNLPETPGRGVYLVVPRLEGQIVYKSIRKLYIK